MSDSADMQANPMREAMRSQAEAELAYQAKSADELRSMGNPAASFMAERMGQMAQRQDVGDELGGMGSEGGIGQAMARRQENRPRRNPKKRAALRAQLNKRRKRRQSRRGTFAAGA
jgi:hypothetical protein